MNPFWALRIHEGDAGGVPFAKLERLNLNDLSAGEVVIEVHFSSVNYKDALAALGKGQILKHFPLNGGIDASGVVLNSSDPQFTKGAEVLVTGCGLSETVDGGFAEVLRVKATSVIPLPTGLTMREAMLLGTAGFTAALALHRMEQNGQRPDLGPILISGASGGVGSLSVQLFAQRGYEVHAVSAKHEAIRYLTDFGARVVIPPSEIGLGVRPLEKVRYGGAVDNVGGEFLSKLLAHVQLWGNVASIGMAQSSELHATVMPFILRGVSLLGTSSNNCPPELRREIWSKLAGDWKPKQLERILSRVVGLKDLMQAFDDLLHRRVVGRILVEVRK